MHPEMPDFYAPTCTQSLGACPGHRSQCSCQANGAVWPGCVNIVPILSQNCAGVRICSGLTACVAGTFQLGPLPLLFSFPWPLWSDWPPPWASPAGDSVSCATSVGTLCWLASEDGASPCPLPESDGGS